MDKRSGGAGGKRENKDGISAARSRGPPPTWGGAPAQQEGRSCARGELEGGNFISGAAVGENKRKGRAYTKGGRCEVGGRERRSLEKSEGGVVGGWRRAGSVKKPGGRGGTHLYPAPGGSGGGSPAILNPERAAVMAATQRPYAGAAFAQRHRLRRRGTHCRAGTCSGPRTRRSRRSSSGTWPSAPRRRSWRCRPRTSRSYRSPRPRPR